MGQAEVEAHAASGVRAVGAPGLNIP